MASAIQRINQLNAEFHQFHRQLDAVKKRNDLTPKERRREEEKIYRKLRRNSRRYGRVLAVAGIVDKGR